MSSSTPGTDLTVDVLIDADPATVWAAVEDVGAHTEWMEDAVAIRFTSEQTSGVGTAFDCDTKVGPIRLVDHMEITEWEPGTLIVIEGTGEKATARDEILFADGPDGGTAITYTATLGMKGVLKVAEPFLKGTFNHMGDEAVAGLASWLAREAG